MTQSKKLLLFTLAALLTFSFAMAATANAKMVKKVDNFILFVDQSGSMAMKTADGKKKIDLALENIQALNKAIPELDYNSGMYLFAPYQEQCAVKPYKKATIAAAASAVSTNFEIFNRQTPMGEGLADIAPVLSGTKGSTALIVFTDGNSNYGTDPVAVAKELKSRYGSNLCIHVVSYANDAAGEAVINGIRNAFGCSVPASAATFADAGALDKYARDVFYEEVADPAPAPAPAPAPIPMEKETISFNLNFGFDKYMIIDEMTPILSKAKAILQADPAATYVIEGHTDSTGAEAYNQGLSERRATSVKNWLIDNGIGADRLESVGYGELRPEFDNTTKEGRRLNRRVEIRTK